MKQKLFRAKLTTAIIAIVELLGIAFITIAHLYNFFEINNFLTTDRVFFGGIIILLFDTVYIWIVFLLLSKARQKSDLKAAELIGGDIQEAYNFGMIGLAVVDKRNIVIWTNDLFKERTIEILDENIFNWQPTLKELEESSSSKTVKISVNSRDYSVKLLKEAGLYIFKDITDFEELSSFSKRQSIVVGQVVIDNYAEISDNGDETTDIVSKVRSAIFDYMRIHNVLIRKIRNDAYFIICNHEALVGMTEDKFSLLDDIHRIGEKEPTPPTLSIGIAYDYLDVVKLNDMAGSALEIAMSRGGDQVVVSQYGQEMVFFGGKTEAQENNNKVKVRVMADAVISLIKNSFNVIIMGHNMTDMDSLGACLGIKAMCDSVNKESKIIYDPKNTERKTKGALVTSFNKDEISNIFIDESEGLATLKANTLVVVCDVHKAIMTSAPKIIEKANKIMVIDHHRRGEDFIEAPVFSDIDSSASSTSEMVAEMIKYCSNNTYIDVPEAFATIMLSGIFMDSNFFKSTSTGARTFEASMFLKECGADNTKADDFLKDEFEEYALINKIVANTKTPSYGVVYCMADNEDIIEPATLAKVGNQCMAMKGVNACFVIGKTGTNEVRISCRSDGSINVQLLAEKLNGGGHFTQAACTFKGLTLEQVETKLLNALNDFLNDAKMIK